MNIDPEILQALTIFLIPGVVIDFMLRNLTCARLDKSMYRLLNMAFFSVINFAVWGWMFPFIPKDVVWFKVLVLILTSAITGIIACYLVKWNIFCLVFSTLGFNPRQEPATAWEKLSISDSTSYVVVHLKSGASYRALLSEYSAVSDDIDHLDLFLEKVFIYDGEQWLPVDGNAGVYIPYTEIESVEFVE